jgi:hypothetical protein
MALQWPEDSEPAPTRRVPRVFAGQATVELFDDDPSEPKRRFAYLVPSLVVLAILVAIGVFLAINGPLPTVFPSCGSCEVPRV